MLILYCAITGNKQYKVVIFARENNTLVYYMTDTITTKIELGGAKYTLTHNNLRGIQPSKTGLLTHLNSKVKLPGTNTNKLKALIKEASCDHVTLWIDGGRHSVNPLKMCSLTCSSRQAALVESFSAMGGLVTGGR